MKQMKWMMYFLSIVLAGCINKENNLKILQGNTWQLKTIQLDGKDLKIPEKSPDLQFTDSTAFYGFSGCNRFFGQYKADVEGNLALQLGGATMMMCPEVEFEDTYLKILPEIEKYTITNQKLVLKGKSGKLHLQFLKKVEK